MADSGQRKALHFGAGNIGRGFIGPLLSESGYHIVFADVDAKIIQEINDRGAYDITIVEADEDHQQTIRNVSGVISTSDNVLREFEDPNVDIVTTAVGPVVLKKIAPTIAKGLSARRKKDAGPLNVIACENMVQQTATLRKYVFEHLDEEDQAWVKENVGFANCSVDRIVPPSAPSTPHGPTPHDSDDENSDSGARTPLGVRVEGYYEWIVDQQSLKQTPLHVNIKGIKSTTNLQGYLERKLFTLNCGHVTTAYLGFLAGYRTIDAAIRDPDIYAIVLAALDESGATLVRKHGFDAGHHHRYILRILKRFENPKLRDEVARVGRQPLRKLGKGDRLLGPANYAKEYGLPWDNLAKGIAAAFLFYAEGDDESAELQRKVSELGIEGAVENVLEWKKGSKENEKIVDAYKELKVWGTRKKN